MDKEKVFKIRLRNLEEEKLKNDYLKICNQINSDGSEEIRKFMKKFIKKHTKKNKQKQIFSPPPLPSMEIYPDEFEKWFSDNSVTIKEKYPELTKEILYKEWSEKNNIFDTNII